MPAIGARGGIQRGASLPKPPPPPAAKVALPPILPPPSRGGSVGAAVSSAARTSQPLRFSTPAVKPRGGSDALSSGPGYGSAQANAYKATPAYHQAIIDVFRHQPAAQQKAIVQGAIKNPTHEGRMILDYVKRIGTGPSGTANLAAITPQITPAMVGGAIKATAGPVTGLETILHNGAKDIWNMPLGTVEGLYGLGSNLYEGHYGAAFHSVVDPFIHFGEHPWQTFKADPVNTLLMFSGAKGLLGRGAGAIARTLPSETTRALGSTARADLHLGTVAGGVPSPVTEARSYSRDLITKGMQRSREKYMVKRGRNPNVAQPAPKYVPQVMRQAFNIGTEAKLNRMADEMTAVRQMAGREERAHALDAIRRAAPATKDNWFSRRGLTATEIANRPHISNTVSHILQGVIRTPETAVEDITKEINRLKAAQTGKRTQDEIWNRRQVRDLSHALKHPEQLPEAFKAAEQIRPTIKTQDAYLAAHGLLDVGQAQRRAVLPYALAHMGAHYDPVKEAFTHPHGAPLSTDEILKHIKDNGVPDPAYVGHFPGKSSPGHFYSTYKLARGSLNKGPFTGARFKSGAYDHSYAGLAGQLASRAEAVTRASLHDKVVNRLGIKMPLEMRTELRRRTFAEARQKIKDKGLTGADAQRVMDAAKQEAALIQRGLFTKDEANHFANAALTDHNGNPIPNGLELTPISTAPANVLGQVKNLQNPHELGNIPGIELRALVQAMDDAHHSTTRNVTLVPSVAAHRFADQFARTDATMKAVGKVTQQFRRTVLPYSTHWMTQIGSEAVLRGLFGGVLDPRALRDGRALMKRLATSKEGREVGMETVNATFFNGKDPLAVHNPHPGVISSLAHTFPPTRALIGAHNRYANLIGHSMYHLEHMFRVMGLGRLARQQSLEDFGHSWANSVRLQGHALDHLASKLKNNPALVAKFGRSIDETFGKYNKFSPAVRAAVQSYAPFLPWYLNAAKYVLWTLPAHHPVASALLASVRQTLNEDIHNGKQAPLNQYAAQELARVSPWGIFTPDTTDPGGGALGVASEFMKGQQLVPGGLLPEAQGALYNYAGLNSFGEGPLKGPNGTVKARSKEAMTAGASSLLESLLPIVRQIRLLREGGKPAYGTSNVVTPQTKPEAGTSVPNRLFNPFYSFERAQGDSKSPAYGKASLGSGGSSGPVIPGAGSTSSVVIPGSGGTSGVVIP